MASGTITNIGERGSGYAILPNGLKICWGQLPAMQTGSSASPAGGFNQYASPISKIYFPIEFNTKPSVSLTAEGGNNARAYWYRTNGVNTTELNVILYSTAVNYEPPNGYWMAIGF